MKARKIILIIIFLISFGLFTYSLLNIAKWFKDNDSVNKVVDKINDITEVKEVEDTEQTVVIPLEETPVEEKPEPKVDPYWEFIKTNLIDVDFSDLKQVNKDVVGWVKVEGTNVNYPFVQASDNKYYLTHNFLRIKIYH